MPVVAILGPRQCGKTTLAKHLVDQIGNSLYLDLESNRDLRKLDDPESFFDDNSDKLICLDEIQRRPDLFTPLRSIVDGHDRNGQVLILGSASPELLKQSSETLAGRIALVELTPFLLTETGPESLKKLWLGGGYPGSFRESEVANSLLWREDFVRTFLERDLPSLERRFQTGNIDRLWQMCAHISGQVLNYSTLASSLGVSNHTVKDYIDLLSRTYMIRLLRPYFTNVKKRLIKSPKIYLRDTGILHALLGIEDRNSLLGHPSYGASWETFAVEQILSSLGGWKSAFYRTSSGNEIDLILTRGSKMVVVECKASSAPELSRGFYVAREDLNPSESWVIAPVSEPYVVDKGKCIYAGNPLHLIAALS
jgi:hypothetical protein